MTTHILTPGTKAVGLRPTDSTEVQELKLKFAEIIDQLSILEDRTHSTDIEQLAATAKQYCITAQMWAVKAITWRIEPDA